MRRVDRPTLSQVLAGLDLPGPITPLLGRLEPPNDLGAVVVGDPPLIVLGETAEHITVAQARIRWIDVGATAVTVYKPRSLAWPPDVSPEGLGPVRHEVARAIHLRKKGFQRCRWCGKRLPREWMDFSDCCMGCAERYEGVVH